MEFQVLPHRRKYVIFFSPNLIFLFTFANGYPLAWTQGVVGGGVGQAGLPRAVLQNFWWLACYTDDVFHGRVRLRLPPRGAQPPQGQSGRGGSNARSLETTKKYYKARLIRLIGQAVRKSRGMIGSGLKCNQSENGICFLAVFYLIRRYQSDLFINTAIMLRAISEYDITIQRPSFGQKVSRCQWFGVMPLYVGNGSKLQSDATLCWRGASDVAHHFESS